MSDGSIKIDTRLDNSKIGKDIKELESITKSGAENVTEEFAQKIEKLSASWSKLEAQQEGNNSKIREYKTELQSLQRLMDLDISSGRTAEPLQVAAYNEIAQKLKTSEANAKGLEAAMSKVGVDANKLKDSMSKANSETQKVKNSTSQTADGMNKGLKTLVRWAGSLIGIRALYSGIQKATNAWFTSTKEGAQAQAELQGIWLSLGQSLAPVFKWLIGLLKTMLGYINAITKAFFGFELFSKASANNLKGAVGQAKELRKQLAGFDEMNVLSSNGQQNLSGSTTSVDFNVETPDIGWLEKMKPIVDALKGAFDLLFGAIQNLTIWIAENFIKGLEVIAGWFSESDISLQDLIVTLGGLYLAFLLIKTLSSMSLFGWVVIAIVGIITAIGWLSENWDEVVKFFDNTIGEVIRWFQGLSDSIAAFFDDMIQRLMESDSMFDRVVGNIVAFFKTGIELIIGFWSGFFSGIFTEAGKIVGNIKGIFEGLILFFSGVFSGDWSKAWSGIVKIFDNIIGGIANIFKAPFNIIIDGINGFIRAVNKIKVPDWVPSWLGGGRGFNIPSIPRLAKGGIVTRATTAEIGEDGREAVVPLQNNTSWAKEFLDVLASYGGSFGSTQSPQIVQLVVSGKVLAEVVNEANEDKGFATNRGLGYGY